MSELNLLFVEDDPKVVDLFERELEAWHAASEGRTFRLEVIDNAPEAWDALKRRRYDGALFDLRIPTEGPAGTEPQGNELARYAKEKMGIPVAIMTANPNELVGELDDDDLVEVFFKNKADAYTKAMEWVGSWWDMMEAVHGARTRLREASTEIFVKRIWPSWSQYSALLKEGAGAKTVNTIVTRQYVSHAAELLGLDGPDSTKWHPFEAYVVPSLSDHRVSTGDLFPIDGKIWVVLSPACDLAQRKLDQVMLVECIEAPPEWAEKITKLKEAADPGQKDKAGRYFRDLINQNNGATSHFLPPLPGSQQPLTVKFGSIRAESLDDLDKRIKDRLGSISAPFLTNLTQRFGAYISRVGQPDIDVDYFIH